MLLAFEKNTRAVSTTASTRSAPAGKIPGRRSPSPYLLPYRNSFLFRIRVPLALQSCLGRVEYRRSLGPCYIAEAKVKSLKLAAAAHEVFAFTRHVLHVRSGPGTADGNPRSFMYTSSIQEWMESMASQSDYDVGNVYTNLRGRNLESLSNEEVRAINGLRAKHLSRYKEVLLQMPAGRSKKKEYRDMPLPKLIRLVEDGCVPKDLRMENNTIKTHCQSVTTFINWAARREYHNNPNIAGLLQVKAEKQPHEFRDPYSDEDIRKLFASDHFTRNIAARTEKAKNEWDSGGKPSRFWIPLLGFFTGARLEELTQLHTDDIVLVNRQEDARRVFVSGESMPDIASLERSSELGEMLCLLINKGKPYQRLKNTSSRRYVPLSPVLTHELDFIQYPVASSVSLCCSVIFASKRRPVLLHKLWPGSQSLRRKYDNQICHTRR